MKKNDYHIIESPFIFKKNPSAGNCAVKKIVVDMIGCQ